MKPIKITLQTQGPQKNTLTTNPANQPPITLAKGDMKRVYNQLTKIMVGIGEISLNTGNIIKKELFKGEKNDRIQDDTSMGQNKRRNTRR